MRRFPTLHLATLSAVGLLATSYSDEARACGGFFCSQTPIDQTAERIIFEVSPPNVTAHIQIAFAGDRDDFAWIVPVPSAPSAIQVDLISDAAIQALDVNTEPRYFTNSCAVFAQGGTAAGGTTSAGPGLVDTAEDGVTVIAEQTVGDYATVTLEGNSAAELITWLQTNGFRITAEMEPYIEPYVLDDMLFVAAKLIPTADLDAVSPLSLTYAAEEPVIPLGLTSVAAQPEMGVKAFVVGAQRYAPANWVNLIIPDRLIEFDQFGFQNNYLNVVSREVDRVGGLAFVTEYAQPTTNLLTAIQSNGNGTADAEQLSAILGSHAYITRLYTRLSAEEMNATSLTGGNDPRFTLAEATANVSNMHDLTSLMPQDICTQPPTPDPCDFTYCGRMGYCVPTPNAAGTMEAACVCATEAIARPTATNPSLQAAVYCEPVSLNLDVAAAAGATAPPDPCANFTCGAMGACVVFNSNPVCRCDAGAGAIARAQFGTPDPTTFVSPMTTTVTCEPVVTDDALLPQLPPVGAVTPTTMLAPGMDIPDLVDPTPAMIPPPQDPSTNSGNPPVTNTGDDSIGRQPSTGGCTVSSSNTANHQSNGALALGLVGLVASLFLRRRQPTATC